MLSLWYVCNSNSVPSSSSKQIRVILSVTLDDKEIRMEVDTGASHMQQPKWKKTFDNIFCCVLNDQIKPLSSHHQNNQYHLSLVVVGGNGPTLLGRNWLQYHRLDWYPLFRIQHSALNDILTRHKVVFKPELGMLRDHRMTILCRMYWEKDWIQKSIDCEHSISLYLWISLSGRRL